MSEAHKTVEQILNDLSSVIRGFDRELERLIEEGRIGEEPNEPIYLHRNKLRHVSIQLDNLLAEILSDDFSPDEARKLLKEQHLLNLIRDDKNNHSPLARILRRIGEIE